MHLIVIKWVTQRLTEVDKDKSTVTAGDFNTCLPINVRTSRQKKKKSGTEDLNNTLNQHN